MPTQLFRPLLHSNYACQTKYLQYYSHRQTFHFPTTIKYIWQRYKRLSKTCSICDIKHNADEFSQATFGLHILKLFGHCVSFKIEFIRKDKLQATMAPLIPPFRIHMKIEYKMTAKLIFMYRSISTTCYLWIAIHGSVGNWMGQLEDVTWFALGKTN